ncbi:hypothetical protein M885DRAFT_286467 [Pelagophyceae sp. CCMP2097]|nr:hypothetical protein M885DRAFT_286467 [Pelagophyceae sp. CCMP2097]
MFAAAAPETRTAAASLVVSLGGDLAAAIEDRLDHPQKKLVDMARNVAQNPVATAAPQRKPAPGAVAVEPVEAQPGDDAVTERPLTGAVAMERPLDRSLTGTATGTYGDENKENARDEPAAAKKPSASGGRALAGVLAVLAEKGVAAPFAVFSATSKWAERMEAVDLVASLLTGASALSEASRDDVDGFVALFEQFVALARDESHVKVVQNVVAALGVLVEYDQGHPAVGAARRGAFAALVPRLKDKRLSVSVSAVCAAIARNDSKLVTDETVLQVLTTSLSVADKAKRLPPSGRAALLAWMAQALPQKLALASCQALAALAAPDASDAVADVRGAACAALAALVLRAAPAQLKAVEALDKRSLKKIAEIHDVAAPSLAAPSQKATDAPKRETAKPSAKADEKAKTGRPSTSGGATTGRPSTSGGASAAKAGGASATAKALAPRPASARPGTQRPQTARSSLEESGSSMAPADLAGVPVSARANAVAEVVTPAVRKGLLEGSDKESWKKRKTALESVLWACRAVSHDSDKFVADGQATRALLGELRARLADSNAKLRPLACDALHALLCAVAPKVAQLKLGKLALKAALGAVTDMSRGVRDRALELLGCVVGEGQGDETNLKAFGDAMARGRRTLDNAISGQFRQSLYRPTAAAEMAPLRSRFDGPSPI